MKVLVSVVCFCAFLGCEKSKVPTPQTSSEKATTSSAASAAARVESSQGSSKEGLYEMRNADGSNINREEVRRIGSQSGFMGALRHATSKTVAKVRLFGSTSISKQDIIGAIMPRDAAIAACLQPLDTAQVILKISSGPGAVDVSGVSGNQKSCLVKELQAITWPTIATGQVTVSINLVGR